jgi:tRNAThr (cytosine32-N3)-methyltransferase
MDTAAAPIPLAALAEALAAIDAAHAADPQRHHDQSPAELAYARSLMAWVERLRPNADAGLRIAARAQHLERWAIPRDTEPRDRPGYLRWRRRVADRQGQRLTEILSPLGIDPAVIARLAALVAKRAPKGDRDAATLEDAACLVFLEEQAEAFAAGKPLEQLLDIVRKTWAKMSPDGQAAASQARLSPAVQTLVQQALAL